MNVIPLDRRFVEWTEQEPPDPDFHRRFGLGEVGIGWDEMLLKRRVVILAEAGSGKSAEMRDRAKTTLASGRRAFHAALEDVGKEGLDAALSSSEQDALHSWRGSGDDAWFFLDSVDEAKLAEVRFEKILRKIADGIRGAESRAHIIISGRITDWEFRRDLTSLKEWLPAPLQSPKPAPTPEQELLRVLRLRQPSNDGPRAVESPCVFLMAPLDRDRVRRFAVGNLVENVDEFLKALETDDLWHFARRPLDLDWLVKMWQCESTFGSLAQVMERSITERLEETNTDRSGKDTLDGERARRGLERIGAAMVFGKKGTVAVPDGEIAFSSKTPLDLAEVLPDWPPNDRLRLLSRAVFDPATLGRVRLHNDNEGLVRGFLTASWLRRLRAENLSTTALFDLLFAKSYDLEVVRPALAVTAAWLSLWDRDVANEVLRRDLLLLMLEGDPASLPFDIRTQVLESAIRELSASDARKPILDDDKLRRFAQKDMGDFVASLWSKYRSTRESAKLLLKIARFGALEECAGLVLDAACDSSLDPEIRESAGRAVLAFGNPTGLTAYAAMVVAHISTLPQQVVIDAVVALFPAFIGVSELLAVTASADATTGGACFALRWEGPRLAAKLSTPIDLENLLRGLTEQLGGALMEHAHYPCNQREELLFPTLASAALRLLEVSSQDSLPEPVVDAVLLICNRQVDTTELRAKVNSVSEELHRTRSRRRSAFWRVVHRLREKPPLNCEFDRMFQIRMSGYVPDLRVEDVEWLLADCLAMGEPDRRLAVDAALHIDRSAGHPAGLREKIASAVASDPIASERYRDLTTHREPTPQERKHASELAENERQNASAQESQEQSWIDFIRDVRADPERISRLSNPEPTKLSSDFLRLFQLLCRASDRPGYAIDDVAPLARIAGEEVANGVQAGLISLWKRMQPTLRSQKAASEWNSHTWQDLMGIAGVSLEAAANSAWVSRCSSSEAAIAAGYATLEINGFPCWLSDLAKAYPAEVREVLLEQIVDETSRTDQVNCYTLRDVGYQADGLAKLLAPELLGYLAQAQPRQGLTDLLYVILKGLPLERELEFTRLGLERFEREPDFAVAAQYLAAVFRLDPRAATEALKVRVDSSMPGEQTSLIDRFLVATFGDTPSGYVIRPTQVPPETLAELVRLAFRSPQIVAQQERPVGVVFAFNDNDYVTEARSALFKRFEETPGAATYAALRGFQASPPGPIPSVRFRELAEKRAVLDSDTAPWIPSDVLEFEQHHETTPRTPKDLRSVLLRRLEDIQHDLLHGDFSQGITVKALKKEVDVQRWVADRLRLKQGRSFSVEREPHVADEKEPDLRVRAKATDANVAVEIKVPETWTLTQLDEALEQQLCGRYLRATDGRHGVLLLVHQGSRPKGWEDPTTGKYLTFTEVVTRLSDRAREICATSHDAPQPEVAVLDVSTCRRASA